MTNEKTVAFIEKAMKVHGDKYSYEKTFYESSRDKVCIICPIHGEFWQSPNKHLAGRGCPECAIKKRLVSRKGNKDSFIEKANKIHNGKYCYDKVEYVNNREKVCIICPVHGEFWQSPGNHLYGYGCPECGFEKRVQSKKENKTSHNREKKIDKRILNGLEPFILKLQEKYGKERFDCSNIDYKGSNIPITLTCNICGETFEITPKKILSGWFKCGCKKENKSFISEEEFKIRLKNKHGDKFSYSLPNEAKFQGLSTEINVKCNKCGEVFLKRAGDLLGLKMCPCCEVKNTRLTTESFIKKAKIVHGEKYDYSLVEYKNNHTKVKIICPEHGVFEQTPANHLYGYGCMKCGIGEIRKNSSMGREEFIKRAKDIHGDKYNYDNVKYLNRETKVEIYCKECNETFFQAPSLHLSGCGCPSCVGKKKYTNETFIDKAKEIHGNKYNYENVEYLNIKSKVKIVCPVHGEFLQMAESHLVGKGCPKCHPQYSKGEKEIVEFIKSIYNGEVLENVRDVISPKELDIYIPELNLAIEYNGLFYHSSKFDVSPTSSRNKVFDCEKQGIRLVTIFEDEWQNQKELVKSMISRYIGKFERIFARKTIVKKIEKSPIYGNFLDVNHIQGKCQSNFTYGLYYNGELVSVMTFTLPRQNMGRNKEKDKGKIELSRFCNKQGISVIGGASKLLKAFINSEEGRKFTEIYSYSDNRISQGGLYKSIGFNLEQDVGVNYFYTDFHERKRKQNFRKSEFKKKGFNIDGKTESQLAEESGFYKIYDCGKKLWTLKINKNDKE